LESETNKPIRAGSNEQNDRTVNRKLSSAQPDVHTVGEQKTVPSRPIALSRLSSGASYSSKPTSPADHHMSGFNSPRTGEQFPTTSMSPRSTAIVRERLYEPSATDNLVRDSRNPFDANPYLQSAFTTPSSHTYPVPYQVPVEHPSRRPTRESPRLPPLNREDTTLSSGSNNSSQSYPLAQYPAYVLPMDKHKTMLMLPQPLPSIGPSSSTLNRPISAMPVSHLPHHGHDYQMQGPLAALVRAGEMASREAEGEMEAEGLP
jgi:hypothetical protein